MHSWNSDLSIKAWNFAANAHQGQCVPGSDIPYINHIGNVVMEAMGAIAQGLAHHQAIQDPDLLIQCALLHDVIEDTNTSFDDIQTLFGVEVANGVLALSKDSNLPTKAEQMQDSLTRIQSQPPEVWMVKLADRITNLQPPPHYWKPEKIRQYREEAILILQCLGSANDYLAARLQSKIVAYQRYTGEAEAFEAQL